MRRICLLILAAALTCALLAPTPAGAQATPPRKDGAYNMQLRPEVTAEQQGEFARLKRTRRAASVCAPAQPIAVSVFGAWHGSSGADSLVPYPNVITNEGNAWLPSSAWLPALFLAPCKGLYFFTISFVRDANYGPPQCAGGPGTEDDIVVYLTKNLGLPIGGAWAGEGDGKRATGTYSVVLRLNVNDLILSYVRSDGGPARCLASYNFTGFRISE